MKTTSRARLSSRLLHLISGSAACLAVGGAFPVFAGIELTDDFATFALGEAWQAHGAGAPDVALSLVSGIGADGHSLRLGSAPGAGNEIVGIETRTAISLAGATSLRVTARVRPLNQTATGDGGASDSSIGVAIVGASGSFARAAAGANRPSGADWGSFYVDSEGSADANVAFLNFPPNDPNGAAEAFRTYVLEIGPEGTRLTTLSSTGDPLAVTPFDVSNPNLPLAAYGASVTVALYQQRSDTNIAPENTFGDVDSVLIETTRATDDSDGDGMSNDYELANGLNPNVNDAALDFDGDGLTNLAESQRGTKANAADSDGDGLRDGVESATGLFVSAADTGSHPLKPDTDGDGLGDAAESGTGLFVNASNTGTNPNAADSDLDGFNDGLEITAGFNPNSPASSPDGATTIATAVEVKFYAAPGVTYRIEASNDLLSWTTIEASIPGAGNRISRLYSTESHPFRYFRVLPN
ncbi:MAG: hypothetical protein ACKV19_08930 [Verrucomicrobiales bacterium]